MGFTEALERGVSAFHNLKMIYLYLIREKSSSIIMSIPTLIGDSYPPGPPASELGCMHICGQGVEVTSEIMCAERAHHPR